MNKESEGKTSIGTLQFAIVNAEDTHLLQKHPLGSLSRLLPKLITEKLAYLGFDAQVAHLIVSQKENNTQKQLIYTSTLPLETVQKVLKTRYFDYLLYGEINLENQLSSEITLLKNNKKENNNIRRKLTLKKYDFNDLSTKIISESLKLMKINLSLKSIDFLQKIYTSNLKAWGWFAISYEDELSSYEREEALKQALENDPDFMAAKLKLISYWLSKKEKIKEARTGINKILNKINPEILNYFAFLLIKESEGQKETISQENIKNAAAIFYEYSLQLEVSQEHILVELIKIYYQLHDINKLKEYLNKYLNLCPPEKINYEEIPFYIHSLGDTDRALDLAQKGVEYNPGSSRIYAILGFLQMHKNNYQEAAANYEKSFSLGFNVGILEDWSAALIHLKEFDRVINIIEKYQDDLNQNSGLDCNLALAYLHKNNREHALEILQNSIKNDPNNPKSKALLSSLLIEAKNYYEAINYLQEVIKSEPQNPHWQKLLGDIYYDLQEEENATKHYTLALKYNPDLKIGRYCCQKAKVLIKDHKFEEAIQKYQEAIKAEPNLWQPFNDLALLFQHLKQDDAKVTEFYDKALQKSPENPEIWFNLYKFFQNKAKGFFKKKWKLKAEEAYNKYQEYQKKYGKKTKVTR